MRNHYRKVLLMVLGLLSLMTGNGQGQSNIFVFGFTNSNWRYEQGGTNPPATWNTLAYNDAAWPLGTGALGYPANENLLGYTTVNTPLNRYVPGSATLQVMTYYFRTKFNYSGVNTNNITLVMSNLVDDGAVFYLNGRELGRLGMAAGAVSYNIPSNRANDISEAAHGLEVLTVTTNLNNGMNVLAVEVHQGTAVPSTSSDAILGMSLNLLVPSALVITNQPESQTNSVGSAAVFTVGVSGGPITNYVWQKETSPGSGSWGAPVPASPNSPTYNIPNLNLTHAGNYRVIVQGSVNSVTSAPAALVIVSDTEGPVMLFAQPASLSGVTNRILIRWSELLNSSTAQMTTNYVVRMFPQTNIVVPISSIIYSSSNSILNVVTTTNWYVGVSNYYITVRNIRDTYGNNVAPNSQIPLAWPSVTNVIPINTAWDYHVSFAFEDVSTNDPPWYATNFVESFNWAGPAYPVFGYDPVDPVIITCIGVENTRIQPEGFAPTYFRTTFNWPYPLTVGDLRVRASYDDGMVLFLNGSEALRLNVPPGPLTGGTRASVNVGDANTNCPSIIVSGMTLRPGLNYLAAAVYQSTSTGNEFGDLTFAMEMDTVSFQPGGLPTNPPPRINLVRQGTNMITSWSGYGWALEMLTDTRTAKRGPGMTNYYIGDWTEVQPMFNPQTNSPSSSGAHIFRLRKAQLH